MQPCLSVQTAWGLIPPLRVTLLVARTLGAGKGFSGGAGAWTAGGVRVRRVRGSPCGLCDGYCNPENCWVDAVGLQYLLLWLLFFSVCLMPCMPRLLQLQSWLLGLFLLVTCRMRMFCDGAVGAPGVPWSRGILPPLWAQVVVRALLCPRRKNKLISAYTMQ